MAELTLEPTLWREWTALAKRKRSTPGQLAELALRDYLGRMADEELLTQSRRAARKIPVTAAAIDKAIKERRSKKR